MAQHGHVQVRRAPCRCKVGASMSVGSVWVQGGRVQIRMIRGARPGPKWLVQVKNGRGRVRGVPASAGYEGSWRAQGGSIPIRGVCTGAKWACPGLRGLRVQGGRVRIRGVRTGARWECPCPTGSCWQKVGASAGSVRVQGGRVRL